ncbi:MAG TPA: carboxypeptidase regulatory-like domain-containing protein [Bryobacteraceae bacterium]|nr:carboxypeptidase regulatory-like domain-containing protein [Bryobacteraceae bacterium]
MRRSLPPAHALAVAACLAWTASAQTTQGLIAGRLVNSQSGEPIARAEVSYSNAATGASGVASSDASGNFLLPMLSPGSYRIRATASGYQTREVQELELPVAARLELNFRMRPLNDVWEAGQYRSVFLPGSKTIVTFYGPDVDSSRSGTFEATQGRRGALESTISQVINPSQVQDLPLAGRDVYTMLVTQPGVTADTGTARGLGLSINGQRPSSSNFMLDGLENNNYLVTGSLTPIAPEAIEEYRVSTNNFSAEYGRTSGYLANAVSRTGGNRFHGLGYFYLKNDALNANGFQENLNGLKRTPAKESQPGFQVSGPILKDRLFFSSAFERLRSRGRQDLTDFRLPTAAFTRLVQDAPATRLSRRLFEQYPAYPVTDGNALTATARIAPPVTVDRSLAIERVDYTSRDGVNRLMGRAAIASLSRPDFIWTPYKDFISGLDQDTLGLAFGYVRTLRPNLVNEAKLGRSSDDLGWDRPHPEVPTLSATDLVPVGNGFAQFVPLYLPGSPAFYAYRNRNHTWEMLDNLLWARGRHVFTAGGGLLLRSSDGFLTAGRDGEYRFNSLFSIILDQPSVLRTAVSRQALPALQQPQFDRQYRYNQYFLFAQDTFKATSRLALNYGVRYEQYGAPRNTGPVKDATLELGRGSSFGERLAGSRMVYPGAGDQQLYQPDQNNWALRFGFSYDLRGNARTLARGAYGVFYDRPYDNLWQNVRTNNFTLPSFNLSGTVNYLAPVADQLKTLRPILVDNTFPNITLFDPGQRDTYVHSYFFGVQQQLTDNWTLEVNAPGSLGRKLIVTDIVNRPYSNGVARFNEDLGPVSYRAGQGLSNYQALTGVVRYRAGRKQFQLSYTWSHTIDNQSEPLARDFFDLLFTRIGSDSSRSEIAAFSRQFDSRGDRGNSDFDQRHNLVFFSIWDLPAPFGGTKAGRLFRDWRFSQLAAFRSGFPYSVREPIQFGPPNTSFLYNGRADVVDPDHVMLDKPVVVPGGRQLLNPNAFEPSSPGIQGNTGRNAFAGPGLYNVDISLSRSFPLRWLGEGGRLTFRADAFNFLNHSNLNNPQPLIGQDDFGVSLYGRQGRQSGFPAVSPLNETARQIQLIFRVEF